MYSLTKQCAFKKILSQTLVVIVLTLMSVPINFLSPTSAQAAGIAPSVTVVSDISPTGVKTATEQTLGTAFAGVSASLDNLMAQKDLVWDGIAHQVAKQFLHKIVTSIVTWINSGFQGSPAFVTDLQGFMTDVADETMGQFIYDTPQLNFLCSPFQLDVKIALAVQYNAARNFEEVACTLSDVVGNVENFMEGSFSEGGWQGWFELTQNPVNTPRGAFLSAQREAYIRILDAQGNEAVKLDWGNGFFSMEICDISEFEAGTNKNCVIGTPGSVIANSINTALDAGTDELIAADEINEIFNALFSQLAQQAITGVYGLLGLGGSSFSEGSTTYLDSILTVDASTTIDTTILGGSSPIVQSLTSMREYIRLQREIVGRIDAARAIYDATITQLQTSGCTTIAADFQFPTSLEDARADAITDIQSSQVVIQILNELQATLDNATSIETQEAVFAQYRAVASRGILKEAVDVVQAELFIEYDLALKIDQLNKDIAAATQACKDSFRTGRD